MSSVDRQGFSLTIDNNPYLPEGSGTVQAVICIAAGKDSVPIPEVNLRLWIPAGARVVLFRQVVPVVDDLTERGTEAGSQLTDYLLGAWDTEERVYHLHVEVQPAAVGRRKLAARMTLTADGALLGEGKVEAIWTDDTALSARGTARLRREVGEADQATLDARSNRTLRVRKET